MEGQLDRACDCDQKDLVKVKVEGRKQEEVGKGRELQPV